MRVALFMQFIMNLICTPKMKRPVLGVLSYLAYQPHLVIGAGQLPLLSGGAGTLQPADQNLLLQCIDAAGNPALSQKSAGQLPEVHAHLQQAPFAQSWQTLAELLMRYALSPERRFHLANIIAKKARLQQAAPVPAADTSKSAENEVPLKTSAEPQISQLLLQALILFEEAPVARQLASSYATLALLSESRGKGVVTEAIQSLAGSAQPLRLLDVLRALPQEARNLDADAASGSGTPPHKAAFKSLVLSEFDLVLNVLSSTMQHIQNDPHSALLVMKVLSEWIELASDYLQSLTLGDTDRPAIVSNFKKLAAHPIIVFALTIYQGGFSTEVVVHEGATELLSACIDLMDAAGSDYDQDGSVLLERIAHSVVGFWQQLWQAISANPTALQQGATWAMEAKLQSIGRMLGQLGSPLLIVLARSRGTQEGKVGAEVAATIQVLRSLPEVALSLLGIVGPLRNAGAVEVFLDIREEVLSFFFGLISAKFHFTGSDHAWLTAELRGWLQDFTERCTGHASNNPGFLAFPSDFLESEASSVLEFVKFREGAVDLLQKGLRDDILDSAWLVDKLKVSAISFLSGSTAPTWHSVEVSIFLLESVLAEQIKRHGTGCAKERVITELLENLPTWMDPYGVNGGKIGTDIYRQPLIAQLMIKRASSLITLAAEKYIVGEKDVLKQTFSVLLTRMLPKTREVAAASPLVQSSAVSREQDLQLDAELSCLDAVATLLEKLPADHAFFELKTSDEPTVKKYLWHDLMKFLLEHIMVDPFLRVQTRLAALKTVNDVLILMTTYSRTALTLPEGWEELGIAGLVPASEAVLYNSVSTSVVISMADIKSPHTVENWNLNLARKGFWTMVAAVLALTAQERQRNPLPSGRLVPGAHHHLLILLLKSVAEPARRRAYGNERAWTDVFRLQTYSENHFILKLWTHIQSEVGTMLSELRSQHGLQSMNSHEEFPQMAWIDCFMEALSRAVKLGSLRELPHHRTHGAFTLEQHAQLVLRQPAISLSLNVILEILGETRRPTSRIFVALGQILDVLQTSLAVDVDDDLVAAVRLVERFAVPLLQSSTALDEPDVLASWFTHVLKKLMGWEALFIPPTNALDFTQHAVATSKKVLPNWCVTAGTELGMQVLENMDALACDKPIAAVLGFFARIFDSFGGILSDELVERASTAVILKVVPDAAGAVSSKSQDSPNSHHLAPHLAAFFKGLLVWLTQLKNRDDIYDRRHIRMMETLEKLFKKLFSSVGLPPHEGRDKYIATFLADDCSSLRNQYNAEQHIREQTEQLLALLLAHFRTRGGWVVARRP